MIWDLVVLLGVAALALGGGMIYRPAGILIAGLAVTLYGLAGAAGWRGPKKGAP